MTTIKKMKLPGITVLHYCPYTMGNKGSKKDWEDNAKKVLHLEIFTDRAIGKKDNQFIRFENNVFRTYNDMTNAIKTSIKNFHI
jgi:hypothetical protein